jgi:uncharacterized protein
VKRAVLVSLALTIAGCARAKPPPSSGGDPSLRGVTAPDRALDERLAAALRAKGPGYRPRTRHLRADGSPIYTNRLILETSPYLLQHAHNPVNWYAWGDEPFERARRERKAVLLSVGYSTCHWCHVMERESFEDEEVARYLNEHFVCIKVDREQRPDVDAAYLKAVEAMTGIGGWPMTVFLTADRKPFLGGTYVPRDRFLALLGKIADAYAADPAALAGEAAEVVRALDRDVPARGNIPLPDVIVAAARGYAASYDPVWGGFGPRPKFPRPAVLELLLRYHRRTGDAQALAMVTRTLERMAAGGIHDQVGGGFHRYATDERWLVPHFEKMLYDNAQLATLYLDAAQAMGRADLAAIARETLDYVRREMTAPEGGFYSATDADSSTPAGEEKEGAFFTWTPAEIEAAVGPTAATAVMAWYDVTPAGNFEGRTILSTPRPPADVAGSLAIPPDALRAAIDDARPRLYAARAERLPPGRDDKIVVSWNGLMISAMSRVALVTGRPEYAEAARRAADFVLTKLRAPDGRLLRSFRDGRASGPAVLDDYAFLIQSLLDLFDTSSERRWLDEALALEKQLDGAYLDAAAGGYYLTAASAEPLLVRDKPVYDGVEPSGNSVALLNLLRLNELSGDPRFRRRAEDGFAAFASVVARDPTSAPMLLAALDFYHDTPLEIVLVAPRTRAETAPLLAVVRRAFVPNHALVVVVAGAELEQLAGRVPFVEGKLAIEGRPTAFVCVRTHCELPTSDPAVLAEQLTRPRPLLGDRTPTPLPTR